MTFSKKVFKKQSKKSNIQNEKEHDISLRKLCSHYIHLAIIQSLLQDSLDDLALQNLELEIFTDSVMAEVAAMDQEIEDRTIGLDELVIQLDAMVVNFEVATTSYVENFQQRYTDNKQERFVFI